MSCLYIHTCFQYVQAQQRKYKIRLIVTADPSDKQKCIKKHNKENGKSKNYLKINTLLTYF